MTREEKQAQVAKLEEMLSSRAHFYLADISGLTAEQTTQLRRLCFEHGVELHVVKNTLLHRALQNRQVAEYEPLYAHLSGSTCVILSDVANAPARLIKEFRRTSDKPILKAAYVSESVYEGDEQLELLSTLKSREELIADVVMLLQSPMHRVVGALASAGGNLSGILKTLSERAA